MIGVAQGALEFWSWLRPALCIWAVELSGNLWECIDVY